MTHQNDWLLIRYEMNERINIGYRRRLGTEQWRSYPKWVGMNGTTKGRIHSEASKPTPWAQSGSCRFQIMEKMTTLL